MGSPTWERILRMGAGTALTLLLLLLLLLGALLVAAVAWMRRNFEVRGLQSPYRPLSPVECLRKRH